MVNESLERPCRCDVELQVVPAVRENPQDIGPPIGCNTNMVGRARHANNQLQHDQYKYKTYNMKCRNLREVLDGILWIRGRGYYNLPSRLQSREIPKDVVYTEVIC